MKNGLRAAAALCFVAAQLVAAPAYAEQATPFRAAQAQTFSAAELQQFGLSAADADRALAYQEQGYQVQVLTAEEAEQYRAGQYSNNTMWVIIGGIVLIILVASLVD